MSPGCWRQELEARTEGGPLVPWLLAASGRQPRRRSSQGTARRSALRGGLQAAGAPPGSRRVAGWARQGAPGGSGACPARSPRCSGSPRRRQEPRGPRGLTLQVPEPRRLGGGWHLREPQVCLPASGGGGLQSPGSRPHFRTSSRCRTGTRSSSGPAGCASAMARPP